jgi:GT2 family glycosyltransferase
MPGHASKPLFSVIIPTYDRLELLIRAIDSVRRQSFPDYEIIVVDDGSRDGTREWLVANQGWLIGIWQSNKGPGAARNAGAQIANGEYLAFLDSDDLWFPWTLDTFARVIGHYDRPSIIAGRWIEFADEMELRRIEKKRFSARGFDNFFDSCDQPLAVGSGTCVLKREAFQAVAFLEDRLNSEDHDLMLQMGTQPRFVQVTSPATVAWRRHGTSETANLAGSVLGAARLVAREKAGAYPGGKVRAKQRQKILTRHMRPVALECLRKGNQREAWRLYTSTIAWNVSLGRFRYLVAFPLIALIESGRRKLAALGSLRPC